MTYTTTISHESLTNLTRIVGQNARTRRVEALLADLHPMIDTFARKLCRINGAAPSRHLDDVRQIVIIEAWRLLAQISGDPSLLARMPSFEQRLYVNARAKVRSHIDHAEAPASGMVAVRRRGRELRKTLDAYHRQGRPTPAARQVVADTNTRLQARLSDTRRQGMVVTEADLTALAPPAPVEPGLHEPRLADVAEQVTVRQAARVVARRARRFHPQGDRAAAILLAEAADNARINQAHLARTIAAALGTTTSRATWLTRRIHHIAKQEFAESPA